MTRTKHNKKLKRNSYKFIQIQSFVPINTHLSLVSTDSLTWLPFCSRGIHTPIVVLDGAL